MQISTGLPALTFHTAHYPSLAEGSKSLISGEGKMKILKKTYSKNNNEMILVENISVDAVGQVCPTYFDDKVGLASPIIYEDDRCSRSGIPARQLKTILIIGVVHGDEPQGKFLIENYLNRWDSNPTLQHSKGEGDSTLNNFLQGKSKDGAMHPRPLWEREVFQHEERVLEKRVRGNHIIFIPCLNPDGLALKTRENANGVDLNRNFPTENHPSRLTLHSSLFKPEIETQFIIDIIEEFKPDIILTLHAPYKVVNYDGPAEKIAQEISKIISYPTSNDIGYPTPGSLGTYAGIERNIPIITLELDEEIDVKELISPANKIFDYLAESENLTIFTD